MTVPAASKTLRIAVLRCFIIPPQIASVRGQFDDIFAAWIRSAVEVRNEKNSNRVAVRITGWDVVGKAEYPNLETVDAIVITGATASAYDDEDWIRQLSAFIQNAYENHPNVKIYGGCFGHQIVSHSLLSKFGVRVIPNPLGWEVGVHDVELSPEFKSEFPHLIKGNKLSYQFLHQDHVVTKNATLPESWIPVGTTDLCEVQGFLNRGRVLTLQGHPEFDQFINRLSTAPLGASGVIPTLEHDRFNALIGQDDMAGLTGEILVEFLCQSGEA